MNIFPLHIRPGIGLAVRVLLFALLLIGLMACDESETATDLELCRDYLDDALWDDAIAICPTDTDEGKSLSGQARMGRAGVSLLDLMDGLSTSSLSGEALIFDLFTITVGSTEFTDVEDAVNLFLSISDDATTGDSNRTDSDNFNLVIASDVLLISLLNEHLSISIDTTTGEFSVPGVTDTGIDTLTSSSTSSEIQDVFKNIYTNNSTGSGSYYTTVPLVWTDASLNSDLSRISTYTAANAAGANALGLSTDPDLDSLAGLDFSAKIDNGSCGYGTGTTIDVDTVVLEFPRRLNTSDTSASQLANDLLFVDGTDLEWQGAFPLPSALLNADHFGSACTASSTVSLDNFTTCVGSGSTVVISDFTPVTENDLTTTITCGGSCTNFPVLDTFSTGNATTAKDEFSAVLDQLYPIDNTVTSPSGTTPSYACSAGDNLVHYREYDAYLRTLGQ